MSGKLAQAVLYALSMRTWLLRNGHSHSCPPAMALVSQPRDWRSGSYCAEPEPFTHCQPLGNLTTRIRAVGAFLPPDMCGGLALHKREMFGRLGVVSEPMFVPPSGLWLPTGLRSTYGRQFSTHCIRPTEPNMGVKLIASKIGDTLQSHMASQFLVHGAMAIGLRSETQDLGSLINPLHIQRERAKVTSRFLTFRRSGNVKRVVETDNDAIKLAHETGYIQ
jgi:hypothetical protein